MNFGELCESFDRIGFPKRGDRTSPDRKTVESARSLVRVALSHPEFMRDCFAYELRLIESRAERWGLTPFFVMPEFGIRFSFGYWSPGGGMPPHEHTAWTVTAVCKNRLDVTTYDRGESYRRRKLVEKNLFAAQEGEVGYIFAPAIHAPKNNSNEWTLSLHISSPLDGELLEDIEPLPGVMITGEALTPHPYRTVINARQRQPFVHTIVRALNRDHSPDARSLIEQAYGTVSSVTRRAINAELPADQQLPYTSPDLLTRVDPGLETHVERRGDLCAVVTQTPNGPTVEFTVNAIAYEAIAYAMAASTFEVRELPGGLSSEEQISIAEMLEATALFHRAST